MIKRFSRALICALLMCLALCAMGEEKPELLYFYENYCGSCDVEGEFEAQYSVLTGESIKNYVRRYYNTVTSAGMRAYEQALVQYGLSKDKALLPLLIIDGRVYAGERDINLELPEYALTASGDTESVIYYLYVTPCESCAEAKKYIDGLPDKVTAKRGKYEFDTDITVIRVDIGEQTQLALALFDAYKVPDDKRIAPMALAGLEYYSGVNRVRYLSQYGVYEGAAAGTLLVDEVAEPPDMSLGAVLLAGLIGGLNPCALSMLLLFLSLLTQTGRAAGRAAAAFLASKFIVYLLIGTVLLSLFRAWNPTWLTLAARIALTAMTLALVFLNLMDARSLLKGEYGQVKNQLPRGLRRRLHAGIERAMDSPGRLIPACVILGAVVAAGEFICAGQVYLATLLAMLRTGARGATGYALLAAYCAAFIMPAALFAALTVRGKSAIALSQLCQRHMPLVKLLTALALLLVCALAWLI